MNAPRRLSPAHATPQHRRDLKPVETIQDAPRLLRIHQSNIDIPCGIGCFLDALRGDFVEDHPSHRNLGLEYLEQMPRDGFPLAVLISGEQDFRRVFGRTFEFSHGFLPAISRHIEGFKVVVDINTEFARGTLLHLGRQISGVREVAHVTD